ncbi:MAG TPA: hypothetical protein VIM73_10770 [Polyangiaceae bacterium]
MSAERSALSEEELAALNGRLHEIVRESGWSRTIAIGDLLVARVFRGLTDAFGAPREVCKHPSIRKLAQRDDCPLRKSALAQAIGVYSVIQKEPDLRELGVTPAHVALVVSFPSEQRRAILERAASQNWSVRTLSRAMKEVPTAAAALKPGRRSSSRRALAFYRASLKSAESGLRLLWRHDEMDPEVASELMKEIQALVLVLTDSGELVSRMQRKSTRVKEDAPRRVQNIRSPMPQLAHIGARSLAAHAVPESIAK